MQATASVRRYQSRALAGVTVSDVRYHASSRQSAHDHPYCAITVVVGGEIVERCAGREHQVRTGSVVVKPEGVVHANDYGPQGARTLQISWQPSGASRPAPWASAFAQYSWIDRGPLAATMAPLFRLFSGETVSADLLLEECLCEIAAIFDSVDERKTDERRAPWLRRVVERLDASVERPPLVSQLAAEVGVHPVYLARAFRQRYRTTISGYLKRRRIGEACRRIASGNESLAAIALAVGFADQPHFCRVFHGTMGMTPARFRRLVAHE
jgi:AraC family transcriptional regulator